MVRFPRTLSRLCLAYIAFLLCGMAHLPSHRLYCESLGLIKMSRERVLHITIHDCDVQTFRSGGSGGQNQNKRDTGVRVIHKPSGARGESREERSQLQNKKVAFRRMAESKEMKIWIRKEHAEAIVKIDHWLDEQMRPENLLVEYL